MVIRAQFNNWRLHEDDVQNLERLYNVFKPLYEQCHNIATRTAVLVSQKNKAKAALREAARLYTHQLQHNSRMTDDGRLKLGIPIHKPRTTKKQMQPNYDGSPADNPSI
jgi:hypothetical protein